MDRMWEMHHDWGVYKICYNMFEFLEPLKQIQVYWISEILTMKHRDLTKYNEDKIVPILPGFG